MPDVRRMYVCNLPNCPNSTNDESPRRNEKTRRTSMHTPQNFSIKFFLTVHILPLLPQIYTGIVVSRQAN